jgi:prepilin-type N-terminal cleavage/methylation domain-containing protein
MKKITTYLKVSLIKGDVWKTGGFWASAFTLVELIVVITILAILWTIAFLSLQWYSQNARDWVRISDIKNIEKWLWVMLVKSWIVPTPDDTKINITASWTVIWIQWYAWKLVQSQIGMSKESWKDPLDGTYYTYYTNSSKTDYQIMWFLEWWLSKNTLLWNSYAVNYTNRIILTKWSELWILLWNSWTTLNQPAQEIWVANIDLTKTTTSSWYTIQFNNTDTSKTLLWNTYTWTVYSVVYNKRNDLLINKTLASADDSLVWYWDMESTIMSWSTLMLKDLSKYGNHGYCYNGWVLVNCLTAWNWPQFVDWNWRSWKAMYFDWVDDRISLPAINTIAQEVTYFIKMKPLTIATWSVIYFWNSSINNWWYLQIYYPNQFTYWNRYTVDPWCWNWPFCGISYFKTTSVYDYNYVSSSFVNWVINLYLDWNLVSKRAVPYIMSNTLDNFFIWWKFDLQYMFNWVIDEVRIYNRALSDLEIQSLYNSTK